MNRLVPGILLYLLGSWVFFSWAPAGSGVCLAGDWAQFQRDSGHMGRSADETPWESPLLKWRNFMYTTGGVGVESPPVVMGDRVYAIAGSVVRALDVETGRESWSVDISGHGTLQTSTPACGDGRLFIATFDGYLMAFDAENGDPAWSRKVATLNFQCPITYWEGFVFIGEGGTGGSLNSYFCLDAVSGNIVWEYEAETAGFLWCGAVVAGSYLVFGNVSGVVTAVRLEDGSPSDTLDFQSLGFDPGRIRASVGFVDGYIYTTSEAGSYEGYVYKVPFDSENGTFGAPAWAVSFGFSTSTPVVYGGRVYVGQGEHGFPGRMVCLNDADGAVLWDYDVPRGVKSSPALSVTEKGVHVHFSSAMDDGFLYCLDSDGRLAWSWDPPDGGYFLQGAAIADGKLYVGTSGGFVYCLDVCGPWDVNTDGYVDVLDMSMVGQSWGATGESGWIEEDVNSDGAVNVLDVVLIGQHWSGE